MSIKANELRIGNWVSNGLGNYTVDANMLYALVNYGGFDQLFSGIPLTPELLEKCGFESINGYYVNRFGMVSINSIQFLHQLQNIYFSLTGEELQINL